MRATVQVVCQAWSLNLTNRRADYYVLPDWSKQKLLHEDCTDKRSVVHGIATAQLAAFIGCLIISSTSQLGTYVVVASFPVLQFLYRGELLASFPGSHAREREH